MPLGTGIGRMAAPLLVSAPAPDLAGADGGNGGRGASAPWPGRRRRNRKTANETVLRRWRYMIFRELGANMQGDQIFSGNVARLMPKGWRCASREIKLQAPKPTNEWGKGRLFLPLGDGDLDPADRPEGRQGLIKITFLPQYQHDKRTIFQVLPRHFRNVLTGHLLDVLPVTLEVISRITMVIVADEPLDNLSG